MINSKIYIIPESIKLLKISDEEYFSKSYISNSSLSLINPEQDGSPKIYHEGLGEHKKYLESLEVGTAVHAMILQPESYYINCSIDKPSGKNFFIVEDIIKLRKSGKSIYNSIKEAAEKHNYFKNKLTQDVIKKIITNCLSYYKYLYRNPEKIMPNGKEIIYMSSYSRWRTFECIKSIKASKGYNIINPKGLFSEPIIGKEDTLVCEIVVEFEGNKVILPLKAKIDNWTLDFESGILTLNDLKTTGKELSHFNDSFRDFHYGRQVAMYLWMLNEYCKVTYNKEFRKFANIITVETSKPFNSGVFPISTNQIKKGILEFRELITKVAYCTYYDKWD